MYNLMITVAIFGMSSGMNMLVEVISADMSRLSEELAEAHSVRLYSRGGHFTKEQMIPVYFMLIYGCSEDDEYNNFLFGLKDDICKLRKKLNKPFAFIDSPLDEPSESDRLAFSAVDQSSEASIISGLCMQINIRNGLKRTGLAQKALGDMLSLSRTNIFEIGMSLVVKMNLIANSIDAGDSNEIPLIMYYGIPKPEDVLFLCYAQRCGFDVICVSPDKSAEHAFAVCPFADKIQKEELPQSRRVTPFPRKMVKAKIATVAYNAERELDTMLYSGDTMFRDRQFVKMDSAVLKTTFDEISILWDQEAKYRSGFTVRGDRVIVPTIFAKVNGVPDRDVKEYWNMVDEMLTPTSIYISKSPSYRKPGLSVARMYAPFHDGKKLDIAAIKRSQLNKYGFLSDELQDLIFEKIQAVIDDGMLEFESEFEMIDYVMYAGLNLDKSILQLLQGYDYTKEIPKIVVADTIEEPFSKLECTQLLLFSYLGFDVIIFSPSGYRDIEVYVSDDAFETHNAGDYLYNLSAPRLKIPSAPRVKKQKGGLFPNLFKKGR